MSTDTATRTEGATVLTTLAAALAAVAFFACGGLPTRQPGRPDQEDAHERDLTLIPPAGR